MDVGAQTVEPTENPLRATVVRPTFGGMKARAATALAKSPAKAPRSKAAQPTLRRAVPTTKVSVSIETSVLAWLVRKVKAEKTTLAALVTDAIKNMKRDEAR